MRKAREHANLNQAELAGNIEIARSSVVNYETDRKMVSRPVLIAWSLATGVPYEWLCHGDTQPCGPPEPKRRRSEGDRGGLRSPINKMQRSQAKIPA